MILISLQYYNQESKAKALCPLVLSAAFLLSHLCTSTTDLACFDVNYLPFVYLGSVVNSLDEISVLLLISQDTSFNYCMQKLLLKKCLIQILASIVCTALFIREKNTEIYPI